MIQQKIKNYQEILGSEPWPSTSQHGQVHGSWRAFSRNINITRQVRGQAEKQLKALSSVSVQSETPPSAAYVTNREIRFSYCCLHSGGCSPSFCPAAAELLFASWKNKCHRQIPEWSYFINYKSNQSLEVLHTPILSSTAAAKVMKTVRR